jgi:response regulator RpfG family c-di-GMP phosphodiesterase
MDSGAAPVNPTPAETELISILVVASVYDMEHIFHGYTVGAVDYLRKSVHPQALRSKVAVFVELFRQHKQIESQAARLREGVRKKPVALHDLLETVARYCRPRTANGQVHRSLDHTRR